MTVATSVAPTLADAERDACAIIGFAKKHGQPTHGNLQRTIEALIKMGHRAGGIGGEGDGCGVLTDIPRLLWQETLGEAGFRPEMAELPEFAVGHLLLQVEDSDPQSELPRRILQRRQDNHFRVVV